MGCVGCAEQEGKQRKKGKKNLQKVGLCSEAWGSMCSSGSTCGGEAQEMGGGRWGGRWGGVAVGTRSVACVFPPLTPPRRLPRGLNCSTAAFRPCS